jgi:hypothetical protein
LEAPKKEAPTVEEAYVASTQQPQDDDVQRTSIEEEEETPIVKAAKTDPIQTLDELPQDGDVDAPFEVPTEMEVEPQEAQPSFEEPPRSLELPISQPVDETQGDVGVQALHEGEDVSTIKEPEIEPPITEPHIPHKVEAEEKEVPTLDESYVPSIQQLQDQDVKPTSIEEEEESVIVKEDTSTPSQIHDKLPQDDDVEAPFEDPTRKEVKHEEVEPDLEQVPRSLELPITHRVEETEANVGVEALQELLHVNTVEEAQNLGRLEAPKKEAPTVEEAYVASTQQPQDDDVQRTSIEEEEETPIVNAATTDPIQTLDELPQDGDVDAPFEVPTEMEVEPQEAQPSFEEPPRSLELPISHPVDETQGDVRVQALHEGEDVSAIKEPEIEPPITEPNIPHKVEAEEKEAPTLEESYVPSIQQLQDQDVKPTSIEEEEETPIVKEDTSTPSQIPDELPQDGDVEAPFEDPTRKEVKHEEVEPDLEEVPRSLELPITHHVEETEANVGVEALQELPHVITVEEPQINGSMEVPKKDVSTLEEAYVPSTQQPQDDDVQRTSIEEEEETPIVKAAKTDPIQTLDELPQDGDVDAPFEAPTEMEVEPQEAQPSFEQPPRSLELPISHPVNETQCDVGVQALREGEDVFGIKELEIEAPITEPQIPHKVEAEEKEAPTLEESYVPSIQQLQDQDVKPTSIEEEEESVIVKEDTSTPSQIHDELPQDNDVEAPFEDPTRKEVKHEEVEPDLEEVRRSLELPITHPIEETEGNVGVQALQELPHVITVKEAQIIGNLEAPKKEVSTVEKAYVPSTEQPRDDNVQPTSIEEEEETPIVNAATTDPIQTLDELPQDGDVDAPFEVPTEKEVEPQEIEPSFEEPPRSLELPISHLVDETQGDVGVQALREGEDVFGIKEPEIEVPITEPHIPHKVEAEEKDALTLKEAYVPSIEQLQDQNGKPTSIEDEEETVIIKEDTSTAIEIPDKLPRDDDVEGPFEDPTRKEVEPEEVEQCLEEVPRSFELPITHLVEETQGKLGVEGLQESPHVIVVEEPQNLERLEALEEEIPTLEEAHVPSTEQPQDEDVQPTFFEEEEEEEETLIVKEDRTKPIQALDELPQDGDVDTPFEVLIEKKVKPEEAEPSFEEVLKSLELPMNHLVEETQGDVGVEALLEGQDLFEMKEPEIEPPIMEPQIPHKVEVEEKEARTLEEPYMASIEQLQDQDVKPTSIEEEEQIPIVNEDPSTCIQALHELPQDADVETPFEVPTGKEVEPKEVVPSFEKVPRSWELPISEPIEETQGNVGVEAIQEGQHVFEVEEPQINDPITKPRILHKFEAQEKVVPILEKPYVPSIEQSQEQEVKATFIEDEEETAIVKKDTSAPIQALDELPQDNDFEAPFEGPTRKAIEPKEVEPSFEEVPRSLELPISHPVEETQGDVGVEALQEGQHVSKLKEPQIHAPITGLEIVHQFETQKKEAPTFEKPYVPSIEQPHDEDVQPTSIEEEAEIPIVKKKTSATIQTIGELLQDNDLEALSMVPTKKESKPEEVEPSCEEVPRSLELPINQPTEETQDDVGIKIPREGQAIFEVVDPHVEEYQVQDKEAPILEEQHIPYTEEPEVEDVKLTSIEEKKETPIVNKDESTPIQTLDELPQHGDIEELFEVPTEKEVEPSFEEVPRSLELPMSQPIEEAQEDVAVEAQVEGQHFTKVEEPQVQESKVQDKEGPILEEQHIPLIEKFEVEDVKPPSLKEMEETPIVKEEKNIPIQALDEPPQHKDIEEPLEIPTQKKVEYEEVEPSFEEVPTSLELPISQPIEETQHDVGVEAQLGGQDFSKIEAPQNEAPITEPRILKEFEAQDPKAPILEEQFIPSTKELEVEDVKFASIEKEETPTMKEEKNAPMPTLNELPQHGDVEEPLEVQAEKEVEPSFEEVPRSLELPTSPPIGETQEHVGVEFPISPPIEETQEDVEAERFHLVEDTSPLGNVQSIFIQHATSVEGDNWRTWKRELEANAMDKLFAQENLAPTKETKNGDILEGPWLGVGSALEESMVSTKDPCGNDEGEALNYLSCQKYHIYVVGNVHLM